MWEERTVEITLHFTLSMVFLRHKYALYWCAWYPNGEWLKTLGNLHAGLCNDGSFQQPSFYAQRSGELNVGLPPLHVKEILKHLLLPRVSSVICDPVW